jgi:hypothetical protein
VTETGRFCCFTCPALDQTIRRLDEECPECGRPLGFPLYETPSEIGDYAVERPLGRGFYAATFVARPTTGFSRAPRVLKVSSKAIYAKFCKDFEAETRRHAEVAEGADHIVPAESGFDADIAFGDIVVPCHVAVLRFVDGEPLAAYLSGNRPLAAAEAAQIAADLFRLREEFERRMVNHNDLHAGNIIIEKLPRSRHRAEAVEPGLRAMAIDLGSVAEDRRSGGEYAGDLHWIGRHIHGMAERLLRLDDAGDLENRIGLQLQGIAHVLAVSAEHVRQPSADDLVHGIMEEYRRTAEPWRPWRNQRVLRTFAQSYNAQTLDAWYVPQLLVDPEGAWLAQASAPGPLIMTGMRGCGKTMLLRALQFHARAAVRPQEQDSNAIERISTDGYVGLLVSAQRLIPVDPKADGPSAEELFARLLVAYAAAAARAMAHLQDLDTNALAWNASRELVGAVVDALDPRPEIEDPATIEQLERYLGALLAKVSRRDSGFHLAANPNTAFPMLAEAIRGAAPIWNNAQVLFLLDDVSTRYLQADRIEELLSSLMFQHPDCAFKMTSEAQTIFLSLKSPGQVHPASPGRDFMTFDLGAQVQARLKKNGKTFITDILRARAPLFSGHPTHSPATLLGDVDLESIARSIAETQNRSPERKRLYHGLRALGGVCVGDIGTVIQIYQEILSLGISDVPVPAGRQNDVFQEFCARHLYSLDRRDSSYKTVAVEFAEASYQLLMESGAGTSTGRLRQYTSLYVRVTSGDFEKQMNRLRDLVDAGVFVFTGGGPRTKTHDSDPVQQFKLTFRKIFGLANFIGLSDRDRFELSGEDLESWLAEPKRGREILLRNLSKGVPEGFEEEPGESTLDDEGRGDRGEEEPAPAPAAGPGQMNFMDQLAEPPLAEVPPSIAMVPPGLPLISRLDETALGKESVQTLVVGLGFEERTPASFDRLLSMIRPERVVGVRYEDPGETDLMRRMAQQRGVPFEEVAYGSIASDEPMLGGSALVDITGLAKPALFTFIRAALRASSSTILCYTAANTYYPLEGELRKVLEAYKADDHHALLTALRDVFTGEVAPYESLPLLPTESDGARLRALSAFASSRHERLLHLVGQREYDVIEIYTDKSDSSRAAVGAIAARVALEDTPGGQIASADASDLEELVRKLGQRHQDWYLGAGLNFEIGLTGTKIQTAASAIIAAALPVNQVWYVKPQSLDRRRYTEGVGPSTYYRVELPRAGA